MKALLFSLITLVLFMSSCISATTDNRSNKQYPSVDFVCTGDDKRMNIFTTADELKNQLIPFISGKTNIHNSAFKVYVIDEIPRNEYGKVKFAELEKYIQN